MWGSTSLKSCGCHKLITVIVRNLHSNRDTTPVITVPKYLQPQMKKHENVKRKLLEKRGEYLAKKGDRNHPIITSKHIPQFNHYLHQTYDKNKEVPLASKGWMNGKHKGDIIIIHPHGPNPHFDESDRFNHSFKVTQLSDNMVAAINQMGYFKPSQCQLRAIPQILRGNNVICSAETGSGKTLAYLAPILENIVRSKARQEIPERHPLAMVVVPTRELVYQIGLFARELGQLVGVGVAPITGGAPKALSHTGYDLIVTTVGIIGDHMRNEIYSTKRVNTLVIDEADTLLDDTFSYSIYDILQDLKFKTSDCQFGTQLCLVSATVPHSFKRIIEDYVDLDSFVRIETSHLHQLMPHVKHVFLRVHKYERVNKLLELIDLKLKKKRRIIIFNRTRPGAEWLYNHLIESGFKAARLHKKMAEEERIVDLQKFQNREFNILVSTDLGSRGLDTRDVTDVINYDAPHHVSDYLHRAGRTGRVGCGDDCMVTTFISFKPDVTMLNKLEYSIRKNCQIEDVNGNIKSILKDVRKRKWHKYLN